MEAVIHFWTTGEPRYIIFLCLVSGQLHWDCKHVLFPRENCCIWQVALLFLVPIWSQNRMYLLGAAGKGWVCWWRCTGDGFPGLQRIPGNHPPGELVVRTKAGASWCWKKHQGFKCFWFREADSSSPAPCQEVQLYLARCLLYTCQMGTARPEEGPALVHVVWLAGV